MTLSRITSTIECDLPGCATPRLCKRIFSDLTDFHPHGSKFSLSMSNPVSVSRAGFLVHYHESARDFMYPNLLHWVHHAARPLLVWCRLFLVPCAVHCRTNSLMTNGPWPQTNLEVLIQWVQEDVLLETLNATYTQGDFEGQDTGLVAWPLRPHWTGRRMSAGCVYHQPSIDSW